MSKQADKVIPSREGSADVYYTDVGDRAKVRFRFTCEHTHTHMGLPFTKGDEILVEPHWAEIMQAQGSGHRIQDNPDKGVKSGE